MRTAAIVLAAGASRRMGTNKLLLMFEGEPIVRRACNRVVAAGLDPLIVVLGHEAERVQAALAGVDCRLAFNPDVGAAMSGSLHRGLECLPDDADAVIVVLADMVNVTAQMLRALALAARTSTAPVIASRYGATLAPPTLFRRALFAELFATAGENCGKAVIERHRAELFLVDAPLDSLLDVDTPQEFEAL